MSYEGLGSLVEQIREASQNINAGDARMHERLDVIEKSVNELYLKQGRPGAVYETKDEEVAERKSAIELCRTRRALTTPRIDADVSDAVLEMRRRADRRNRPKGMVARFESSGVAKKWHIPKTPGAPTFERMDNKGKSRSALEIP